MLFGGPFASPCSDKQSGDPTFGTLILPLPGPGPWHRRRAWPGASPRRPRVGETLPSIPPFTRRHTPDHVGRSVLAGAAVGVATTVPVGIPTAVAVGIPTSAPIAGSAGRGCRRRWAGVGVDAGARRVGSRRVRGGAPGSDRRVRNGAGLELVDLTVRVDAALPVGVGAVAVVVCDAVPSTDAVGARWATSWRAIVRRWSLFVVGLGFWRRGLGSACWVLLWRELPGAGWRWRIGAGGALLGTTERTIRHGANQHEAAETQD